VAALNAQKPGLSVLSSYSDYSYRATITETGIIQATESLEQLRNAIARGLAAETNSTGPADNFSAARSEVLNLPLPTMPPEEQLEILNHKNLPSCTASPIPSQKVMEGYGRLWKDLFRRHRTSPSQSNHPLSPQKQ
jgi:hypothetical protein